MRAIKRDPIVVGNLFARPYDAHRFNEYPPALLGGLAVWVAGVIDPARGISVHAGVDVEIFVGVEQKGVRRNSDLRITALGLGSGNQRSLVLDQSDMGGD